MAKKKKGAKKIVKKKREEANILWFNEIGIKDVELVGGKNASLGEMYSELTSKGVQVPNGFAVSAHAYWQFLEYAGLQVKMKKALHDLDVHNVRELTRVGKKVREMILKAKFPPAVEKEINAAYRKISKQTKTRNLPVAVRSSATAEDLPDASFAGQQETFLNIRGEVAVFKAVKKCIASLFTARAISYREAQGFDHMEVALSVTVQQMVNSGTGASGVMFTMDTESGFDGVTLVTSSYGLGEYVVAGRIVPDQFYVFDDGLRRGKNAIISRTLGSKQVKLTYGKKGGTLQVNVPQRDRNSFSIDDKDVIALAKWGAIIEKHYGRPQDIEWAKDGKTGKLYIVQARPETVQAHSDRLVIEKYRLKKESMQVLSGIAIGSRIGSGKVRIIESPKDMRLFKKGDVLVTRITDPDWEPIMRIAGAIVTEQGGKTSHAAIVSRELGVPCVVGAHGARKILKNGQPVTVSCAKGDEGQVFKGILPFEVKRTELKEIPKTKTKVQMIVGDPDHAFDLSFLPHDGIGLARLEFIFSNFIKIHPLALVHYNKLKDKAAKKRIRKMTAGYDDKTDYCVDKLSEGIGRLAASMYPHDVVVRLSDFKSNEYAKLIGGKAFEPHEENPMLGWRGASRYYSKEYEAAFKLECEAIKRVRNEWGLDNVIPMVPFCRTPEEGERVLKVMKKYGLERGKKGLKVYVMSEIPSNVILAEEFAMIFDGFSIGTNDLTQMVLGTDRDSSLISHIADPNNPAVKKMVKEVIRVAKKNKIYVGLCGQAPSDYPEFATFLVKQGIDSISLQPDTVVDTRRHIARVEKTVGKTGKKTNKPMLSLVAALGLLSAMLMGAGSGCAEELGGEIGFDRDFTADVNPAEIRERARDQAQKLLEERKATITVEEGDYRATVPYPNMWGVEAKQNHLKVNDPNSDDYLTISFSTSKAAPEEIGKKRFDLGEYKVERYFLEAFAGEPAVDAVDIILEDNLMLHVEGSAPGFEELIKEIKIEKGV